MIERVSCLRLQNRMWPGSYGSRLDDVIMVVDVLANILDLKFPMDVILICSVKWIWLLISAPSMDAPRWYSSDLPATTADLTIMFC